MKTLLMVLALSTVVMAQEVIEAPESPEAVMIAQLQEQVKQQQNTIRQLQAEKNRPQLIESRAEWLEIGLTEVHSVACRKAGGDSLSLIMLPVDGGFQLVASCNFKLDRVAKE